MVRLVAAVLLLAICWHAAPVTDLPPEPVHGSAFSAATIDVALVGRQECPAEQRMLPDFGPAPLLRTLCPNNRRIEPAASHWPVALEQAPPPRERHGPQVSPRAPPVV